MSATKINAGVPRAFLCALDDVLNPTRIRLIKVWTSIESAFISSGCHSASVIWSVLTDIVILHVGLMGHIITSVGYVEYLCDAAHNCLVDLLLTLLPHEKTFWHWWNSTIQVVINFFCVHSRCVASLEHGPPMCASARVSGRLLEQHILLLLSRFQYIEMTSIPTTNPGLHEVIIGALGSPAFCAGPMFTSKSRLALFQIILTTAQLDRENNKAVLDSVTVSNFCPCASSKDACALLEWLFDRNLNCFSQIVLSNAVLFEQRLVACMVPPATLRVLYRALFRWLPPHLIDRDPSVGLSSVYTPSSLCSSATAPMVHAQVELILLLMSCMPYGFTSRFSWQGWLPRCLSIVLHTGWSQSDLPSLIWSIQQIFSLGYLNFLDVKFCEYEQLSPWIFLGVSLGCRSLMFEYASLFYEDFLWLIGRSMVRAKLKEDELNLTGQYLSGATRLCT